jgi:hypothetical protein
MAEFEYTYANWMTFEGAARLTALRNHRAEVAALMLPDSSGTDHSVSIQGLQKYDARLEAQEEKLAAEVAAGTTSPFQRIRRVRG